MVTEMITMKLDGDFLKQIDAVVRSENYQNRTEFIRNAVREKVEEAEQKKFIAQLTALRGAGKKAVQTMDEDIHRVREEVFNKLKEKFK